MTTRLSQLFVILFFTLVASTAGAHELWVLTPDQVIEWQDRAKPSSFTQLSAGTIAVLGIALLINFSLVQLNATGARELFPIFRARMHSYRHLTSPVLRFCLAWVLISSTFALEPRFGNAMMTVPTLLAPDLSIKDLPVHWQWLRWAQLTLGLMLLAGIYVRVAAVGVVVLGLFCFALIGSPVLAYLPSITGLCLYLFFAGAGAFYLPLPIPAAARSLTQGLEAHVRVSRAQFILRILAGANFLYLAVYFKVLQPNLMLAIIDVYELPTFGFKPEIFTLIMATVEVSIAALILANILLRFLSLVLLAAFLFFAYFLSEAETVTSHMLYYGVAFSFLFGGGGRWKHAPAKDNKKRIVVLGGGIAALSACTRLERLLPDPSNVELVLINDRLDYQLTALLPEVVSGAIQPATLINTFARALTRTKVMQANVSHIDTKDQTLSLDFLCGTKSSLSYDELIYARSPVNDTHLLHPTNHGKVHHLQYLGDALAIRRSIMERVSSLECHAQNNASKQPLNFSFAIVGGGQRGSALAVEIRRLLDCLELEGILPAHTNMHFVLFENGSRDTQHLCARVKHLRARYFTAHNIRVVDTNAIRRIRSEGIELKSSGILPVDLVINLGFQDRTDELPLVTGSAPLYDSTLQHSLCTNVWMANQSAHKRDNPQRSISRIVAQSKLAALNAWAHSQGHSLSELEEKKRWYFEFYMGRATITTLLGFPLPSFVAWLINRWRFLNLLPCVERKLRITFDWILGFVFHNDIALIDDDRTLVKSSNAQEQPSDYPENRPLPPTIRRAG